ncbi:hypothetical protein [Oscillibacter sp.]|uniref:hypothetical protein n=1 Tax=Oscillibacter sp. TaxID=1945593 RepID=UPI0026155E04|nr:hypothetical protein [Oscillibacter sp.]
MAETLAETAASVSESLQAFGSRRRKIGRKARARPLESPQTFMISMTPVQRHSTPAMDRLSRMAESAPVSAAEATASRLPVATPKISESTTIPVHTQDIAIIIHLHFPIFYKFMNLVLISFAGN